MERVLCAESRLIQEQHAFFPMNGYFKFQYMSISGTGWSWKLY